MKGKLKTIAFLLVLILLCSIIAPTINVFASTSKTIKITSTGITSRVVFTTDPDDDSQNIEEFFVDEQHPVNEPRNNDRYNGEIFIQIEPDINTGGRITSIKINGDSKTITKPTGRNTYSVPETATEYIVEVESVPEPHYNIMWANSGAEVTGTKFDDPEILLKNGAAKIIKVYDNETDMNDITDEIEHADEGCVGPEGRGYVSLAEGNVVIFEFVAEYGYQLTSVSANGLKLEAQETTNQYKYIMPATDIHFQATFTKTEDVVKSSTSKVTSGTVKIGENEISSGTTVLSVKDATLTDEQKSTFKSKAGDYTVNNVLDIKLDQVFYKGNTDSSDVWTNSLEDLRTPATITLKLDEGVDGDTVVLVHEKNDGTYEIIPTTYDPETNTITFKTSSFSNYAIASKTVAIEIEQDNNIQSTNNTDNPKTGDNIKIFSIIFVIALTGIVATCIISKKKVKNNK